MFIQLYNSFKNSFITVIFPQFCIVTLSFSPCIYFANFLEINSVPLMSIFLFSSHPTFFLSPPKKNSLIYSKQEKNNWMEFSEVFNFFSQGGQISCLTLTLSLSLQTSKQSGCLANSIRGPFCTKIDTVSKHIQLKWKQSLKGTSYRKKAISDSRSQKKECCEGTCRKGGIYSAFI